MSRGDGLVRQTHGAPLATKKTTRILLMSSNKKPTRNIPSICGSWFNSPHHCGVFVPHITVGFLFSSLHPAALPPRPLPAAHTSSHHTTHDNSSHTTHLTHNSSHTTHLTQLISHNSSHTTHLNSSHTTHLTHLISQTCCLAGAVHRAF